MAKQGIYAEMGIDASQAEQALLRVQKLAETTEQTLTGLITTAQQTGRGFTTAGAGVDRYGRKMTEGERALRGFYREQRLQDRTMRESIATLTGLTFAFGYLTQNEQDAGSTTAKVTKALMGAFAASQAAEFGFFALGQAGEKMGGTMGKVFGALGRLGTPLSLVVGAVAGLAMWVSEADAKMTQWTNTGIANMTKALIQAAGGKTTLLEKAISLFEGENVDVNRMLRAQAAGVGRPPSPAAAPAGGAPALGPSSPEQMLKRLDQAAAGTAPALTTAKTAQASILEQVKEETNAREDIIQKIKDSIQEQEVMLSFEEKVNKILKENGSEWTRLQIRLQEIAKALQFDTMKPEERRKLLDEQQRLTQQGVDMNKSSLDLQIERTEKAKVLYEMNRGTAEQLIQELQAQKNLTLDANKRLAIEKMIWDIKEAQRKTALQLLQMTRGLGVVGLNLGPEQQAMAEEQIRYEEAAAQIKELGALKRDENGNVIEWTWQAQDALFANEAAHIRRNAQIQREADEQHMDRILDSITTLTSGMQSFFSKSDTGFSRMIGQLTKMVQAAIQIAKLLRAASQPGGAGTGSLETVLSIVGIALGGFARGGYTGKGERLQPAGVVHRGEIVFEKPIVDRYGMELLALRASLQRNYALGGMVGAGVGTALGTHLVVTGKIDLDNGQLFLRKEMPGFQEFDKRKRV